MELLIPFVVKSFLIAGTTVGLLHLLRRRSASERSMVAHVGLLALVLMPVGSAFLPQLVIGVPGWTGEAVTAPANLPVSPVSANPPLPPTTSIETFDPVSLWPLLYGLPVALLLLVTAVAVLRLLALRARASVLVEPSWLSALAHAQRRMNFKHGTALLTSSDLKSPISWGVLRPVILLNDEALRAGQEAEAIIAHELAHVRGLDWAKLLLARIVTALFWFNPLVWILAREAHQLREETADDAVLAADVANVDYAQLLVGVARHECHGMLLGAHGVAPSKGSLSRRVRRVLDAGLPRTPVGRGFAAGIALGVVATAAPLAALSFSPRNAEQPGRYYLGAPEPAASLPSVVAGSVADATALTSEVVTSHVAAALTGKPVPSPELERRIEERIETRMAEAHPHPGTAAVAAAKAPARHRDLDNAIDEAIALKAVGASPEYAAQIRSAMPGVTIDDGDLIGLKAVGVTPEWLAAMARAGYRVRDAGDLTGARAVGITPAYVADLAAAGYRNIPLGDLTSMRAMGVTGRYIRELKARGVTGLSPGKLIELKAHGISASALAIVPPTGTWPPGPRGRVGPRPPLPPEPEPDDDPDAD
jgi:beta-lactamase regulating signal transducer with metallopeptidase domain